MRIKISYWFIFSLKYSLLVQITWFLFFCFKSRLSSKMQNWVLHRFNYQEMPLHLTAFFTLTENVYQTLVEKGRLLWKHIKDYASQIHSQPSPAYIHWMGAKTIHLSGLSFIPFTWKGLQYGLLQWERILEWAYIIILMFHIWTQSSTNSIWSLQSTILNLCST